MKDWDTRTRSLIYSGCVWRHCRLLWGMCTVGLVFVGVVAMLVVARYPFFCFLYIIIIVLSYTKFIYRGAII